MIAEIGHFALILAFAVAIFQMIVPMIGAARGWSGWIDSARPAAVAHDESHVRRQRVAAERAARQRPARRRELRRLLLRHRGAATKRRG